MDSKKILEKVKASLQAQRKEIDDTPGDDLFEEEEEDLGHGYYNGVLETIDATLQEIIRLEEEK